jgi:predicted Fe-S protein YdhL (DUF1289 family)
MESPCIKNCLFDRTRQLCSGCGRTLDEITGWYELSDEERRKVMALLPQRLAQFKSG